MSVARLSHELEHNGTAHECFRAGNTLAILPMNGRQVSAVVTLRSSEAPEWMALSPEAFAARVEAQFDRRLGAMVMTGERHAYPLVAVYADRFVGKRFALMGDAAVGMHPVTAHGFNFGLKGADTLARGMLKARASGSDFASPAVLQAYESTHRRATLPLCLATHAVAKLYTSESLPSRVLRDAFLGIGQRLTPFKRLVAASLTGAH